MWQFKTSLYKNKPEENYLSYTLFKVPKFLTLFLKS